MRLTNTLRANIKGSILAQIFTAKFQAVEEKAKKLAVKAYDKKYKNFLEAVPALHSTWIPWTKSIKIIADNQNANEFNFKDARPVPFADLTMSYYGNHNKVCIQLEGVLLNSFMTLQNAKRTLEKEYTKTEAELKSLLLSVNTSAQLIKLWPEVVTYYDFKEPSKQQPSELAPIVDNINKLLK